MADMRLARPKAPMSQAMCRASSAPSSPRLSSARGMRAPAWSTTITKLERPCGRSANTAAGSSSASNLNPALDRFAMRASRRCFVTCVSANHTHDLEPRKVLIAEFRVLGFCPMDHATLDATPPRPPEMLTRWQRVKAHPLARVGPGLITGAADDDPSGIATYSQAGAQFGLDMLWTMPLAYPLMSAIQCMCAFIGRTTGKGLAANIKTAFPPIVLTGVVLGLLVANTLNIAADLAAMGEAAALVTGVDRHVMTTLFVAATLLLQIFVPYHRYVFFLKWLTLSLLAYVAVLFVVHVPWGQVALHLFVPRFKADATAAAVVV